MKKLMSVTAAALLSAALLTAPASAACRPSSQCGGTNSTQCGVLLQLAAQYLGNNCGINIGNIGLPQISISDIIYPNLVPGTPQAPSTPQMPGTSQTPGTPQTPETPQTPSTVQDFESEVVSLVNGIRAQYGLSTLSINEELCQVARYKSEDMATKKYFAHESPTYGSPFQMMQSFGISYRTAGENIAYGQRTPEEVVNAWMNSPSHRENILNSSYTQIGVGYYASGNYWTQMFIG